MLNPLAKNDLPYVSTQGILTAGAPLVDLVVKADEATLRRVGIKEQETHLSFEEFNSLLMRLRKPVKRFIGGEAFNVAFALVNMSRKISFLGRVGIDLEGASCLKFFRKKKIIPWLFVDTHKATGKSLTFVREKGEILKVFCLEASSEFNEAELTGDEFRALKVVHFTGECLRFYQAWLRMMRLSIGKNAMISLRLPPLSLLKARLKEIRFSICEFVDVLFGSFEQIQALIGGGIVDPEKMCWFLLSEVKIVCLMTEKGIWLGSNHEVAFFSSKQVTPLDRNGVDELFCAGVLHGIRWNWNMKDAVVFAQELASVGLQREGPHLQDSDWSYFHQKYLLDPAAVFQKMMN